MMSPTTLTLLSPMYNSEVPIRNGIILDLFGVPFGSKLTRMLSKVCDGLLAILNDFKQKLNGEASQ